jgi:nucleoside-diphosphate-sugar epimerase
MKTALVAGASGLIGGHLVAGLLAHGYAVRAVGRSPVAAWKQVHAAAENVSADLMLRDNCYRLMSGVDVVFNLAAEIGGVNFIEHQKAQTMLSVLINTHLLMAARDGGVSRYFYASSDAVAAAETPQQGVALTNVIEDGHIWEKLFSEKLCKYFREDFGLLTRIGRLQNVYGDYDKYDGGRERAPAALCRKAILAKASGNMTLEIWGDGSQMRSFAFAEDVATGIRMLAESDIDVPVRIGSDEYVSINHLVDVVEAVAGIKFERTYKLSAPAGTRRTQSVQGEAEARLGWTPRFSLKDGMTRLYHWIEQDMKATGRI